MGTEGHLPEHGRIPRRFPRVALVTPVEIHYRDELLMGSTQSLGAGGLSLQCNASFAPGEELWVRFNLPTGHSVYARAVVLHPLAAGTFGLEFTGLQETDHAALLSFCRKILGYQRRSERVARRFHVTVWRADEDRGQTEQLAETLLVSRHGGLLMCRAHFLTGETVCICRPQALRIAKARIVDRKESGHGGPVEIAFEFLDTSNFWDIDFADESGKWSFKVPDDHC